MHLRQAAGHTTVVVNSVSILSLQYAGPKSFPPHWSRWDPGPAVTPVAARGDRGWCWFCPHAEPCKGEELIAQRSVGRHGDAFFTFGNRTIQYASERKQPVRRQSCCPCRTGTWICIRTRQLPKADEKKMGWGSSPRRLPVLYPVAPPKKHKHAA